MDKEKEKLGTWDLLKIFFRLLFIQGLLNRMGMQNMGFASALSCVEGKYVDEQDPPMSKKHMGFFNCNPNFTPLVIGGVLRMEEERSLGKPVSDKDIEYFKRAISGPLAAMGDMLFLEVLCSLWMHILQKGQR